MSNNYYSILGISHTATSDDIKKAFRKLSKKYHPDKNPNNNEAEEYYKKVTVANEHLSCPIKRKAYDQKLNAKKQKQKAATSEPMSNAHYTTVPATNLFVFVFVVVIMIIATVLAHAQEDVDLDVAVS